MLRTFISTVIVANAITFINAQEVKPSTIPTSNRIEISKKGVDSKAEEVDLNTNNTIFIRESIIKVFESQLKGDGIITPKDKRIQMNLTNNTLFVNGKLQSEILTEKYISMYFSIMRKERCSSCSFTFDINKDVE